jgi:intracellular multiplication protein IcmL
MQNQEAAVSRRLSDPDFQARVVRHCMRLTLCLLALFAVDVARDFYKSMHPARRAFYRVDGRSPPQPMVALTLQAR